MTLNEVRNFPTTIDTGPNSGRVHESVLRSFQIVKKTKELLERGTPAPVLLELIEDMMTATQGDFTMANSELSSERAAQPRQQTGADARRLLE